MSRFGGPGRASADDLAYGDIPQRWDRDRFERFGARGPPTTRFHEDYHFGSRLQSRAGEQTGNSSAM